MWILSFCKYKQIEAFPEPVRYWEKVPDKVIIEANEQDKKYTIESTSSDTYKFTMRLNITNLQMQDYGEYNCIAKNEMGIAKGVFYLQSMFQFENTFIF